MIHGLVTQSSKTVSCVILEEVDWTRIQKNPVEMKTRQIWFPYGVISLLPRQLSPERTHYIPMHPTELGFSQLGDSIY